MISNINKEWYELVACINDNFSSSNYHNRPNFNNDNIISYLTDKNGVINFVYIREYLLSDRIQKLIMLKPRQMLVYFVDYLHSIYKIKHLSGIEISYNSYDIKEILKSNNQLPVRL